MIYVDCAQGSKEWHQARSGVITASKFTLARAKYKSGKRIGQTTDEALDYAFRLAIERISGEPLDDGFETWQMARGRELEPDARRRHEEESGVLVQRVGFVKTDDNYFGASLDGTIDDDGSAEYKCFLSPEKLRSFWIENDIGDVQDQVQGQLWLSARAWCDTVLYCPALAPAGKDIWCRRIYRDDDFIAEMELDLVKFLKIVNDYEKVLRAPVRPANDPTWPFPQRAA